MTRNHNYNLSILETKNYAGARPMLVVLALGLLALSLAVFAGPAYASGGELKASSECLVGSDALARFHAAKLISDPANGAMSLSESEFYVAQYGMADAERCETLALFQRAKPIADPANGAMSLAEAEFYVAQYGAGDVVDTARREALARFQAAKPIADPANGAMSLAEAKFYVAQAETSIQRGIDADAARYQALGGSYLAKAIQRGIEADSGRQQALGEFYGAQYGAADVVGTARREALTRFQMAKPIADPANGALSLAEAEFYVAKYSAESTDCTSWSDALARFQRAKPIADPANGALSLGEAEFYVAKYGVDGAGLVTLEPDGTLALCSM
jgi:hypothetical protein